MFIIILFLNIKFIYKFLKRITNHFGNNIIKLIFSINHYIRKNNDLKEARS